MNYQNAVFELSAGVSSQLPACTLPEIVFSGKSNVGKSSLINKILQRKGLARVSAEPGKTATINFYKLTEMRFADLPGYGYAKVSHSEKMRWGKLIEDYFAAGRDIRLVVQILDCRHEPTGDDVDMLNYLLETERPFLVVCTKCDKLNVTQRKQAQQRFTELFRENRIPFLFFSAQSGEGVAQLQAAITAVVQKEK